MCQDIIGKYTLMAKRTIATKKTKRRAVSNRSSNNVLFVNRIKLADLQTLYPLLSSKNIAVTGNNYLIDTTDTNSGTTRHYKTAAFMPNGKVLFDAASTNTHSNDSHQPSSSFIATAAAKYYRLASTAVSDGRTKLRLLARTAEYCEDVDALNDRIFDVEHTRPQVKIVTPSITHANITDNILLTYADLTNRYLKTLVGLPNSSSIMLHNPETDVESSRYDSPQLSWFIKPADYVVSTPNYTNLEASHTMHFVAGSRTTNSIQVNPVNAAHVNIHGILAVKAKPAFADALKTVTLYVEVADTDVLSDAATLHDTQWFVAESAVIPVHEYGNPVTVSAYLYKNAVIRLRINLDSTMGSLNMCHLHAEGGFSGHYSNAFHVFSGIINKLNKGHNVGHS